MGIKMREIFIKAYAHPSEVFVSGQLMPVLIASILAIPASIIWFDWSAYWMWIVMFVVVQIIVQPITRPLRKQVN